MDMLDPSVEKVDMYAFLLCILADMLKDPGSNAILQIWDPIFGGPDKM